MPAEQSSSAIDEATVSATVLPEEQERRRRSANVVMYGLSGDSSACLRQAAQEVFQALNPPDAGQHVVAVEPLPTQGPHPPVVVRFDDPCWSTRLLCSKRSLRRVPARPGCTVLSISPGPNRLRDPQGSPGQPQCNNWAVPSGGAVR